MHFFTFSVYFALKLPNVNSMNIKCFSASHPSAPLVCQGTQVVIINTNMTCCYDKQQQLKEHQALQGRGGHPCVVSFGAFGGLKVMSTWMSMVTQVSAWYRMVWQPASLSSLALAMLSFSQKIPSHSSLPPSNLLHPLGHASERILGSGKDSVRDQSWLWGKCGVFFSLPMLFSSWISFLGWLTDMLYGQVCVRRDFPQCWHRMRCGEMQECQEPATLWNKTPHPHILAQVAGATSGEMEPKCLQQALD